jgi:regulator of replication initiation timing
MRGAMAASVELPMDQMWPLLDAAERWLDIQDDIKTVMDEKCASDERHCACVPHLRKQITELLEVAEIQGAAIRESNDETRKDIDNLKKIHDKIEQLTDEINHLKLYNGDLVTDNMALTAENLKLKEENEAMRLAVEFYAEQRTYQATDAAKEVGDLEIILDCGEKAREVLERFKKK